MEFSWRIKQDGMIVAGGSAPTQILADKELYYYAVQYAQDGPIIIETRCNGTRWRESI